MDTWPLHGAVSGMNQLQLFPPLCLSAPSQISEKEHDSLNVGMLGCVQGESWVGRRTPLQELHIMGEG